jgi:uncharacterized RDD family membrane protein YckC
MAKLIVNPTSSNRREIALSRTTLLTVGRDPSNDLVLPDAMVSRRHAVIEHRGGQFFLRDCSSANGSVVNGDRVSERVLRDGDLVAIGSMRLLFREEPPEVGGGKVVPHPSAAPLRCPGCDAEYRRGDLFCRECGAQVAQPVGPPRASCPSCGTRVALPARFCTACGDELRPDGQRLEEPPAHLEGPRAEDPGGPRRSRSAGSMAVLPEPDEAPALEGAPTPLELPFLRPEPPPVPRRSPRPARETWIPASFAPRLAAALVDAVFVGAGQALFLAPVGWYWWSRSAPAAPSDVAFLPVLATVALLLLAVLVGVLYHVYFWSVKGATPGKELLGLRVETEDGATPLPPERAALRAFGYLLSLASLGVGFLMIAFGGSGLHDRVASTRVTQGPRP